MYILDKYTDFYDYYSNIYGVDKKIVFDRRGSVEVTDDMIVRLTDIIQNKTSRYFSLGWNYFIVLEVGFVQYLLLIDNVNTTKDCLGNNLVKSYDMTIVRTFEENKHFFESPISLHEVFIDYTFRKGKKHFITEGLFSNIVQIKEREIKLPILTNTKFTTILDAEQIWKQLQTYISSLNNDKDVAIDMKDVEKAEIHGFDKKTSFRHPIK